MHPTVESGLRLLLIIINILFVLIGLLLVGAGIYLVVVGVTYSYFTGSVYAGGAIILMLCGLVTVFIAILGILGALGRWWNALVIYSIILAIIIFMEVVAAILGFTFAHNISSKANLSLDSAINKYTSPSSSSYDSGINAFVNAVQSNFKCCGTRGPGDWLRLNGIYISVYGYPESCHCQAGSECERYLQINITSNGCNETFHKFLTRNSEAIGAMGLVFGLTECVGVIVAVILAMAHVSKWKKEEENDYIQALYTKT